MPVQLIEGKRFGDERGWFTEVYGEKAFAERGIVTRFVQDNHSLSRPRLTLRGLHFQTPPHAQAKLVRCIRGAIFDVAVDLRRDSPSFGHWVAARLSAENNRQLLVPVGFAHGFLTLEPDTEVMYKVSDVYAPHCDAGLIWNDSRIGIPWPLEGGTPVLSPKDMKQPDLDGFESPFAYDGVPLGRTGLLPDAGA